MSDVFVSYSRRNQEFVQRLVHALINKGKTPWFDRLDQPLIGIPASTKWWDEITYGIETADNFLFVISPESIISPYCHSEISHARQHNKRLITVLYCDGAEEIETLRAVTNSIDTIREDQEIPITVTIAALNLRDLVRLNWRDLSQIQYVTFSAKDNFEISIDRLVQGLDLDIAWVKMHSQLHQDAELWKTHGYDEDFLWGSGRLKLVSELLQRVSDPNLTDLELNFIRPEYERLLAELDKPNTSHLRRSAIGERLLIIGDPRPGVALGNDNLPDILWSEVIAPGAVDVESIGKIEIKTPFQVSVYPVTHLQFKAFLDAKDGAYDSRWWEGLEQKAYGSTDQKLKFANYPRENVSWFDAIAFCRWLSFKLGGEYSSHDPFLWKLRLPTEAEWIMAATGGDSDNIYPWGKLGIVASPIHQQVAYLDLFRLECILTGKHPVVHLI